MVKVGQFVKHYWGKIDEHGVLHIVGVPSTIIYKIYDIELIDSDYNICHLYNKIHGEYSTHEKFIYQDSICLKLNRKQKLKRILDV